MSTSPCSSIQQLGLVLQAAYASVAELATGNDDAAVLLAQRDLARVHGLITLHRGLCPQCRVVEERGESAKTRDASRR
jgi:hypothetical protein